MTESKKDRLLKFLKELENVNCIEGSAIVTRDGLLIAPDLPENVPVDTFAAMSATMTGAAETAISEMKKGSLERVIVEGDQINLIAKGAGSNTILISMASKDANLGLVLTEMKKTANRISNVINEL